YGAVPTVLPEWMANVFFQFESNVRTAVVLGIVGVGGLGFLFGFEFEFFRYRRAATYLLVMVALAAGLDPLSRHLGLAPLRRGEGGGGGGVVGGGGARESRRACSGSTRSLT